MPIEYRLGDSFPSSEQLAKILDVEKIKNLITGVKQGEKDSISGAIIEIVEDGMKKAEPLIIDLSKELAGIISEVIREKLVAALQREIDNQS